MMAFHPEHVCVEAFPSWHPERVLHEYRYRWAGQFLAGYVIDAGCGFGYGSSLLADAEQITYVHGFDLNETALWHAVACYRNPRNKYRRTEINFTRADLEDVRLAFPAAAESIVCLEILEHLKEPAEFLARVESHQQIRQMVLSVPIGKTTDTNPHHKVDFMTPADLINMLPDDWSLMADRDVSRYYMMALQR